MSKIKLILPLCMLVLLPGSITPVGIGQTSGHRIPTDADRVDQNLRTIDEYLHDVKVKDEYDQWQIARQKELDRKIMPLKP